MFWEKDEVRKYLKPKRYLVSLERAVLQTIAR